MVFNFVIMYDTVVALGLLVKVVFLLPKHIQAYQVVLYLLTLLMLQAENTTLSHYRHRMASILRLAIVH